MKALLISLLSSLVFLASFALLYDDQPVNVIAHGPTPASTTRTQVVQPEKPPDPNEKFRLVPEDFAGVDFGNWQYGRYKFGGRNLDITLTNGSYEVALRQAGEETFSLSEVLYTDVTGDEKPEAIARISHVSCGGSCDGGSEFFYVYQSGRSGLTKIWEYETGSMAYGCGLKSVTVTRKQIAVEMFGQCWKPASSFSASGKFMVRDITRSVFYFNGRRFVNRLTEVTAAPVSNLRYYNPDVSIKEY